MLVLAAHLLRSGSQRQKSVTISISISISTSATTTLEAVSYSTHARHIQFWAELLAGSTTVYPYNNSAYEPVELGASIFVEVNKNLQRAVKEFNLRTYGFEDEDGDMGIWDGERFLYTVRFLVICHVPCFDALSSEGRGIGDLVLLAEQTQTSVEVWLSLAGENTRAVSHSKHRFVARPHRQHSVRAVLDQFVTLYEPDVKTWSSIESLNNAMNWTELTNQTGIQYFSSHGVSEKFATELIEAGTLVNYAQVGRTGRFLLFLYLIFATQTIDSIHALEAACSISADGGVGVSGGNWQIFEQFVKRSGARAFLNTEVGGSSHETLKC